MGPDTTRAMISSAEAAEILGLHRNSVLHMLKTGKIPGTQIGKRWLIRVADVEAITGTTVVERKTSTETAA